MPEPLAQPAEEAVAEDASIAYLDQFAQLDGSVPDLAATLTTQAEQDAEDANISFLRGELFEDPEEHHVPERSEESRRRRRRAVDAMLGGRRYTPEQMREIEETDDRAAAGQDRARDYDGWAPGASEDEEEYTYEPSRPLPRLADEHTLRREESQNLRERMRNRLRRDYLEAQLDEYTSHRRATHPEHGESAADQHTRSEEGSRSGPTTATEASLRTTALLQAVRRNTHFSAQSRNHLQRFILDRERVGGEADDRPPPNLQRTSSASTLSPSQRRHNNRDSSTLAEYHRQLDLLDQQDPWNQRTPNQRAGGDPSRSDRRTPRYWTSQPGPAATCKRTTRTVDNTIKYLERLRLCESDQEGRETAEEGGFESEERDGQDFLTDTTLIPSPPESSWLSIGGVLSGTQNAVTLSSVVAAAAASSSTTPGTALPSYAPLMPPSQYRFRIRHPTFGTTTARTTSPVRTSQPPSTQPASSSATTTITPPINPSPNSPPPTIMPWLDTDSDERWPVKVTIHSVDYSTMTLSGTMEAFNVPDKSSPTRESSITTFLEGEIIDFNKHTLETKTFKADTRIDAVYWRKLPPFCHLKDEEAMVRKLCSKEWMREELMEKWILMRWKEKCFVTPSDAQSSLTISGFYYVSLRRSNGHVEGLYYDPSSTPYQHLVLRPEKKVFPSYAFQ